MAHVDPGKAPSSNRQRRAFLSNSTARFGHALTPRERLGRDLLRPLDAHVHPALRNSPQGSTGQAPVWVETHKTGRAVVWGRGSALSCAWALAPPASSVLTPGDCRPIRPGFPHRPNPLPSLPWWPPLGSAHRCGEGSRVAPREREFACACWRGPSPSGGPAPGGSPRCQRPARTPPPSSVTEGRGVHRPGSLLPHAQPCLLWEHRLPDHAVSLGCCGAG